MLRVLACFYLFSVDLWLINEAINEAYFPGPVSYGYFCFCSVSAYLVVFFVDGVAYYFFRFCVFLVSISQVTGCETTPKGRLLNCAHLKSRRFLSVSKPRCPIPLTWTQCPIVSSRILVHGVQRLPLEYYFVHVWKPFSASVHCSQLFVCGIFSPHHMCSWTFSIWLFSTYYCFYQKKNLYNFWSALLLVSGPVFVWDRWYLKGEPDNSPSP